MGLEGIVSKRKGSPYRSGLTQVLGEGEKPERTRGDGTGGRRLGALIALHAFRQGSRGELPFRSPSFPIGSGVGGMLRPVGRRPAA
jgi:hypothetical protein